MAQESDSFGGSYFTHDLLSGLRAADANGDRKVTVDEAYGFVYSRTIATSHASVASVQHPAIETRLAGEGELVLSYLEQSQAGPVLAPSLQGTLLVVDERGDIVAEFVRFRRRGDSPGRARRPLSAAAARRVEVLLREGRPALGRGADRGSGRPRAPSALRRAGEGRSQAGNLADVAGRLGHPADSRPRTRLLSCGRR